MKKALYALRGKIHLGEPPSRGDTFQVLEGSAGPAPRRARTGRTEQFNVRVKAGFKQRVDDLARQEKETLGAMLETMLAAYESGASAPDHSVPVPEARKGRTTPVRLWVTDAVFSALGQIAAERKLSVSGLFEDMLAHEVARLDPHGGKFGIEVKR